MSSSLLQNISKLSSSIQRRDILRHVSIWLVGSTHLSTIWHGKVTNPFVVSNFASAAFFLIFSEMPAAHRLKTGKGNEWRGGV
jgi:hypothetical protein